MDNLASLVATRAELRRQIKALEAEVEQIDNQLKPVAQAAFAGAPDSVWSRQRDGLCVTRKKIRTDLRSSSPRATAAYLSTLAVDVLSPSLVAKAKLDALDPLYSDGKVLLAGEAIPGLEAKPVWSFDYEPLPAVAAEDLL